jgi:hypothetical protein
MADMAAELENDRQENVRKLAQNGEALKEARWVKKRFSLKMKKERFMACEAAEVMAATIL